MLTARRIPKCALRMHYLRCAYVACRVADYAYEQLVEAGYSTEAIKLAGFGQVSWSFGGVTWKSTLRLAVGDDDSLSESSTVVNDEQFNSSRMSKYSNEHAQRDIAAAFQGPTFHEWQQLLEVSKSRRRQDGDGSSDGAAHGELAA